MPLFNGAVPTLSYAFSHLFTIGGMTDSEKLRQVLKQRYAGEVTLYSKGRAALADAVEISGKGKVLISGLTCYSVVDAVKAGGGELVYIDIDNKTLNPSIKNYEQALKKHKDITAIIVQNMLGLTVDITAIKALCNKHGVILIEDLAHSAGATYASGEEVGTVGDMTMLSFGKDKAIDTVNGGVMIVRNPELRKTAAVTSTPDTYPNIATQLRDRLYPLIAFTARSTWNTIGKYIMSGAIRLGLVQRSADGAVDTNETLPHWQAKLAARRLTELADIAGARSAKARVLDELLTSPTVTISGSPLRYPLVVGGKQTVLERLAAINVLVADTWYDTPVGPSRLYDSVDYDETLNKKSVEVSKNLLNLPLHKGIQKHDLELIAGIINEVENE